MALMNLSLCCFNDIEMLLPTDCRLLICDLNRTDWVI